MRGITKGKKGESQYDLAIEECQSVIDWCALKLHKHKKRSNGDPMCESYTTDVNKAISLLQEAAVILGK